MKYEQVEQIVKKHSDNAFIYRYTSNQFRLLDKDRNPIINITLSQMNKLVKKNIINIKHSSQKK